MLAPDVLDLAQQWWCVKLCYTSATGSTGE